MNQENEKPEEAPKENTRPVAKFTGSGGIQVAIWKEKSESGRDHYSIKIERSYKDEQTERFNSTNYFKDGDLLRLRQLLLNADAWIEMDKGKLTGYQPVVGR